MSTIPTVPTEISRITGLRNDIRSRLIQVGALADTEADLEACRDAMANVSTLTLDSIAITNPPDKDTYSPGEVFDPTGMVVTAYFAYGDTTINFIVDDYTYPEEELVLGTDEVTISYTFGTITKTAIQEIGTLNIDSDLDANSWETISWVAKRGLGSTYWSVGDRKAITLGGRIGDELTLTNVTLYVYILDFNHPENGVPDNNIIFGGFFTAKTGGKDVCLVDSYYGYAGSGWESWHTTYDGNLFNINHNQYSYSWYTETRDKKTYTIGKYSPVPRNYGGWKGCDFRYDILGSTKYPPSQYRANEKTADNTGYDATEEAITNPVEKTLMAALPSAFRNVLRLRTHYTDNIGGANQNDGQDRYTSAVTDAISLLTEVEIYGSAAYSQPYSGNYQTQMAYYANGGAKSKYKHSDTNTLANWWSASPRHGSSTQFLCYKQGTALDGTATDCDYGFAPVFKV